MSMPSDPWSTPWGLGLILVAVIGGIWGGLHVRGAIRHARREQDRGAGFRAKALLNRSEARLYRMITHRLPDGYRLMAQVSYGEMLVHTDLRRYHEVAARRADMVITDKAFNVVAVIEYQGGGHAGFTAAEAIRARRGDRLKSAALEAAGLVLIKVPGTFTPKTVEEVMTTVFPPTTEPRTPPAIHRTAPVPQSAKEKTG